MFRPGQKVKFREDYLVHAPMNTRADDIFIIAGIETDGRLLLSNHIVGGWYVLPHYVRALRKRKVTATPVVTLDGEIKWLNKVQANFKDAGYYDDPFGAIQEINPIPRRANLFGTIQRPIAMDDELVPAELEPAPWEEEMETAEAAHPEEDDGIPF